MTDSKQDLTRGCRFLDCPHGFPGNFRYVRVSGQWFLFSWTELPEALCIERKGEKITIRAMLNTEAAVTHCFKCGQVLDKTAPLRNYIPTENPVIDERVQAILAETLAP